MSATTINISIENSFPPNHTLYINNLNWLIKKQQLRKSLYNLFISYGHVVAVIAIKCIKMRGQAFTVIFDDMQNSTTVLATTSQSEPKPHRDKSRIPSSDRTIHEHHIALMKSEEVNRTANAVTVAQAESQELPLRDRTRCIQSIIVAQTTLVGTTVPLMTEIQLNLTLFVSNLPTETTLDGFQISATNAITVSFAKT